MKPNPLTSWAINPNPNPNPPTQPAESEFFASLRAAHAAAEAERVESAELGERFSAQEAATMQETIKRMEAKKTALEAQNAALKVTSEAATAAKDAAEAAAAAAAARGSSGGSGAPSAKALADAVQKAAAEKSAEGYAYPRSIALPMWPAFDSSVQFNENDPAYADGHVHALAWRKVWQVVKEHFEAVRDEYTHSLYNAIMKVHVSLILDKDKAARAGHLFHDANSGRGIALADPLALGKAAHINATVELEAHAD